MKFQDPNRIFEQLDRPKVSLSGFDLSHRHTTTFDMGEVIPIALLECMPNDRWNLDAATVLRMQPLLAPILHGVKLKLQAWFCPNRILLPDGVWENFITGGDLGTDVPSLPLYTPVDGPSPAGNASIGSLWDRFGYNPIFDASADDVNPLVKPLIFAHRFYTKLWNDWFRIPGLQPEIDIFDIDAIFHRPFFENWPRDYFSAALPFLQRGVSPSLPVLGSLSALSTTTGSTNFGLSPLATGAGTAGGLTPTYVTGATTDGWGEGQLGAAPGPAQGTGFIDALEASSVWSGTTATTVTANLSTVDTKQIRLAFLYQAFLERMARGGARYAEMLPNIWGAKPLDMRLNRVEYIGGYTAPWLTSEVLQTAPQTDNGPGGDTTVQGAMAGHGINLSEGRLGSYRVSEHGYILITACTYPDAMYQQGMPRHALRRIREEFPSPSFAGLSEQEIFNAELYNQTETDDPTGAIGRTPFGYTGRYNEMRYQPSIVSSEMRTLFDYWHLGRQFSTLPQLDDAFLNMTGSNDAANFKRIFAVQNVPGIVATFGIRCNAVRPIPFMAVPAQLGGS